MGGAFVTLKDNGEVGLVIQTEEVTTVELGKMVVKVHCKKLKLKNVVVTYVPEKESDVDTTYTAV